MKNLKYTISRLLIFALLAYYSISQGMSIAKKLSDDYTYQMLISIPATILYALLVFSMIVLAIYLIINDR